MISITYTAFCVVFADYQPRSTGGVAVGNVVNARVGDRRVFMVSTAPTKPTRRPASVPSRVYRLADLAAILDLSLAEVSERSLGGLIPGRIELGRAVRHDRALVDRWYAELAGGNDDRAT